MSTIYRCNFTSGLAFWVKFVAPGLSSTAYLSYVVCKLLHRSGTFIQCPKLLVKSGEGSGHAHFIEIDFDRTLISFWYFK